MAGRNGIKEILESRQFPGTSRATRFKEGFDLASGQHFKSQRQKKEFYKKKKMTKIGGELRSMA